MLLLTPMSADLYLLHGAGDVMSLGGIVQGCHRDVEGSGSRFYAQMTITDHVKSSLVKEKRKLSQCCLNLSWEIPLQV